MKENCVLALFAIGLLSCVGWGFPLPWALLGGYILFFGYGLTQHIGAGRLLKVSWEGIRTVYNILAIFILIGILTASWRASGTIAYIIYYTTAFIQPRIFLLAAFLLCSLISLLLGTSFGSAATIGVICMTMGTAFQINPVLTGGAILSGIYVGDRASPMSSSALLTATLTHTDIYKNIVLMLKSSLVPFTLTALIYLVLGFIGTSTEAATAIFTKQLADNFTLTPVVLLPAVVIVVFSLGKIPVKRTMLFSSLIAFGCCLAYQGFTLPQLVQLSFAGYVPSDAALRKLMGGGGIKSMLNLFAIIFISSSYTGIFRVTGLLNNLKSGLQGLAKRYSLFGCMLLTSLLTCMVSCNQTLGTILTYQLCGGLYKDNYRLALTLSNTGIVLAALIPWCIAAAAPLAMTGAPTFSLVAASYLYLVPLYNYFWQESFLQDRPKEAA